MVLFCRSGPSGELSWWGIVLGIVVPVGNGWALFLSSGELSLVGSSPRTVFYIAYPGRQVVEAADVLQVVSLPHTRLVDAGGKGQVPAQFDGLRHPQLVQLSQVPPVPTHLKQEEKKRKKKSLFDLDIYGALSRFSRLYRNKRMCHTEKWPRP